MIPVRENPMSSYFVGSRLLGPFSYKDGSCTVTSTITEAWRNTGRGHTLRCGISSVLGGSHERGIDIRELESFEASIGGTLGKKGIASLSAQIKANSSIELTMRVKETLTDDFTLP